MCWTNIGIEVCFSGRGDFGVRISGAGQGPAARRARRLVRLIPLKKRGRVCWTNIGIEVCFFGRGDFGVTISGAGQGPPARRVRRPGAPANYSLFVSSSNEYTRGMKICADGPPILPLES